MPSEALVKEGPTGESVGAAALDIGLHGPHDSILIIISISQLPEQE